MSASPRSYDPKSDQLPTRRVHPLEFGRKSVALAPAPMPDICPTSTCRMGLVTGRACDLKKAHSCRLMAKSDKTEPKWRIPPRL